MRTYTKDELTEILRLHKMWLNDEGGECANLSSANLSSANLSSANLSSANLSSANLSSADLSYADLRSADLSYADLISADLRSANLRSADLRYADLSSADLISADLRSADLSSADLISADLSSADLSYADLSYADLSQSKGLIIGNAWMVDNFKVTKQGYIVYKCFGKQYTSPGSWKIEPGAYIEETVNQLPTLDCACGINFATKKWVEDNHPNCEIWECLIEWKDACLITVPYNTDGKARCGRLKLIKIVS